MSLSRDQIRRFGGAAGIVFVVLGLIALFLPGSPPKADEIGKITPYFLDERGSILAGNYIAGVAFAFFLVFLAALRENFGASGRDGIRPGSIVMAGGVVAAVMVFAGNAVINAAVYKVAAARDIVLNRALYDLGNDLFFMSGFGFLVFFWGAAMAIRGTGALPGWLAPAAVVAALVNLLAPIGLFAKSGFFAIGGAFGFIGPLVTVLWVVAASVCMLRGEAAAPARHAPSAA